MVIHPRHGTGEDIKFLGCHIDCQLNMQSHIEYLLQICRPKIKAMLRTRGLYDLPTMLQQFKTHIWSIIEHHNGSLRHATATLLARLDGLQVSFLDELQITEDAAFVNYNFAPLGLRRDIGILGFLHKRVLGLCHPGICKFLPMAAGAAWHNRPLKTFDHVCTTNRRMFERSIFYMIHVYNRLPQYLIDCCSVSAFQKQLTQIAKHRCIAGDDEWASCFHSCSNLWRWRMELPYQTVVVAA